MSALELRSHDPSQDFPKPFEREIIVSEEKKVLPVEVFFNIVSFWRPQDLLSGLRVCKSWNWALCKDCRACFSKKNLFQSREDLLTVISRNMAKDEAERKEIYEGLLRLHDDGTYSKFKREFDEVIRSISLKDRCFYYFFINQVKEMKKELKVLFDISSFLSKKSSFENIKEKLQLLKENTQKEIYSSFMILDRESLNDGIDAHIENLRNKYEQYIVKLIFIFINDPRPVMYLNSANYSGFRMVVEEMDDNLETMIKSVFVREGKAIFEIVKSQAIEAGTIHTGALITGEQLAFPKHKFVSSYEPLKKALEIYINQKNPSSDIAVKKRRRDPPPQIREPS